MPKFKKILLPIDLEEPDLEMVRQTSALAHHFDSEILILHVIQPLSSLLGLSDLLHGNLVNESAKRAEAKIDASVLSELDGLAVKRFVAKGNPATQIVQTAQDLQADLIVMGTHGFGNVERVLVGSVTAKVLNTSNCPVWTGAHLSVARQNNVEIHNILCAVDFGAHSRSTLNCAAEMAGDFGAQLTLAHVTPSTEIYGPGGYHVVPDFKEAVVSYATKELTKLEEQTGVHAEVFVGSGDVGKVLSHAIQEKKADLLVIGRCNSARHLGSNGYAIIREAHIPVLSV